MDDPSEIVAAEAAVTAALEPPRRRFFSRRRKVQPPSLPYCENCGASMAGPFCAQCGQHAVDYRRSFRHVIVDVLDSFLNWDSKFFATIALLILKPWRLTNEFLAGKRVRYVHPLRLYLLASILFFFAVNYGARGLKLEPGKTNPKDRAEIEADLKREDLPPAARDKLQALLRETPSPTAPSPQTISPSPPLAPGTDEQRQEYGKINERPSPAVPSPQTISPSPPPAPGTDKQRREYGKIGERPFVVFDSDTKSSTPFERWMEARAKEKMGEHGTKMGLFIATLFSNLPYMMLCCVPLFAFVLKILYIRRHIFYIDHLIHALHIHTFAYVGIMLIALATIGLDHVIPGLIAGWTIALLWIAFVVQIFLSIRRVYRQGWFISTLKFFTGGVVYLVVLLVALAATFFITLAIP